MAPQKRICLWRGDSTVLFVNWASSTWVYFYIVFQKHFTASSFKLYGHYTEQRVWPCDLQVYIARQGSEQWLTKPIKMPLLLPLGSNVVTFGRHSNERQNNNPWNAYANYTLIITRRIVIISWLWTSSLTNDAVLLGHRCPTFLRCYAISKRPEPINLGRGAQTHENWALYQITVKTCRLAFHSSVCRIRCSVVTEE